MRLTEMQAALDAADGNKAEAARSLGIARTTFLSRIGFLQRSAADEAVTEREATGAAAEVKRLRKQLALADEQIKALRSKRRSITGKARKKPKGSFARVIIPDTHGCYLDKPAAKAFLDDLASINPREIVMLGDHLDCGGFLALHHTMCYVAESAYTFKDDVAAANEFLDRVQDAAPNATIHMLQGNHERRIEKWIVTQVLRNEQDAAYLSTLFSASRVLALDERGINYYVENEFHHGLRIRGAIKLGDCHFTHGISTARHAAAATVAKFGGCIVYGHTHRADSFIIRNVSSGAIGAWSPGCLCEIQPYYGYTNITDWSHGYGLQFAQPDGRFLHLNVPIIDGLSLLPSISLD
jgi:predicted phosphodiesterase/transposase-like protein